MKGSTLHRAGLTKEKMSVLAGLAQIGDKKQATRHQLNQYYKTTKTKELDLLWNGVQKGMQRMHQATKSTTQKSPATYLTIGFIAGVLFMSCIILIVSIFSISPNVAKVNANTGVAVIGEDIPSSRDEIISQEKYIVKKGDTMNGISYRFYGKYDEAKILEIQRINAITNVQSIRVGQELLIPVSQER